jgi:tRNA(Ile2)-agmatinylcytidine synthase
MYILNNACAFKRFIDQLRQRGIWIYIAMDDTDSTKGMCTTYLASEIMAEFSEVDVIGYPRLVRLNPNIPWKTRGNGAISLRFGKGLGKRFEIGEIAGKRYYGFERSKDIEIEDVKKRAERIVRDNAQFQDKNTNPAFVIMDRKPPQILYWLAVREIVRLKDVVALLKENKAQFKGFKNKRGLIGSASAISWRPHDRTYEIISYREKKKWGTKRKVDVNSVKKMDKRFLSTFNNYDHTNKIVAISPNSPCPVLFGIRGDDPKELPRAKDEIISEKIHGWILFETNQGTDEHLQKKRISEIRSYSSVITKGTVSSLPVTIKGGHVFFSLSNGKDIDCAAYEPTKEFRQLVRKLEIGDIITVYGGVRETPLTINIEKLRIHKLVKLQEKSGNPKCPKCKRKMKSIGRNAGYRCIKCREKVGESNVEQKIIKRNIDSGLYEVPVCARRHLSKPIARYDKKR